MLNHQRRLPLPRLTVAASATQLREVDKHILAREIRARLGAIRINTCGNPGSTESGEGFQRGGTVRVLRAPRGCPDQSEAGPDFVPGLPHVFILIELRRALISYQDYRMILS